MGGVEIPTARGDQRRAGKKGSVRFVCIKTPPSISGGRL
jgi:hypothetical protein